MGNSKLRSDCRFDHASSQVAPIGFVVHLRTLLGNVARFHGRVAWIPPPVPQPLPQLSDMEAPHIAHGLRPPIRAPTPVAPLVTSANAFHKTVFRWKEVSNDSNVSFFDRSLSGFLAFCCCKVRCRRINTATPRAGAVSKESEEFKAQPGLWMACAAALPGSFQYGFGLRVLAIQVGTVQASVFHFHVFLNVGDFSVLPFFSTWFDFGCNLTCNVRCNVRSERPW